MIPALQGGTLDGTEYLFLQIIIPQGKLCKKLLGFLPLGISVGKTGVFYDMDIAFIDKAATFPFRHIHQRTDGIELFSVQEANGSKAVQATLIKQRHKKGFHNIILIMPQSDLIAAKLFRHIIQCALPHFCTKRAGIFFFSLIKNDFADIGFYNGIMHTQLIAECLYAVIACAGQTEGDGNCLQLKPLGIEAL